MLDNIIYLDNEEKEGRYSKIIFSVGYLYMLLPVIIFIGGYLKSIFAIILLPLLLWGYVAATKVIKPIKLPEIDKKAVFYLIAAFVAIVVWCLYCGIGGYTLSTGDLPYRNTMYELLVNNSWPVHKNIIYDGDIQNRVLCYYIGTWFPSALVGKLFGVEAGWFFQLVWSALGIYLCYLIICLIFNKVKLWPIIVFMAYDGLDYVGTCFRSGGLVSIMDTNSWWAGFVQFASFTSQLANVFNQALPAWLATFLILSQKENKNSIFVLGCLLICSVFPFIGLAAIVIMCIAVKYYDMYKNGKMSFGVIKGDLFTYQNVISGGIAGITAFIYYLGNVVVGRTSANFNTTTVSPVHTLQSDSVELISLYDNFDGNIEHSYIKIIMRLVIFVILEVGIYLLLVFKTNKKNPLFYITLILSVLIPCIVLSDKTYPIAKDFSMRASIPVLILLYLLIINELNSADMKKKKLLIAVLVIGSCNPLTFSENYLESWSSGSGFQRNYVNENWIFAGKNFSANADNIFNRVFGKDLKPVDLVGCDISFPIKQDFVEFTAEGTLLEQDNGCWMVDRYSLVLDGETDSDLKLSVVGNIYEDAKISVYVNKQNIGYLKIEGENRDKDIETIRSIYIDNSYLKEQGQLIELVCENPQIFYVNEDISNTISMFMKKLSIQKIGRE